MPFEIVRNDITKVRADAIVNAASRYPRVNAGVDGAIHKKAGPALLAARKEIGYIAPGSAAVTPAYGLESSYVIHAATPTWKDGQQGEAALLRRAYDACLALALEKGCQSIAFPLLASGNHGFPRGKALQAAVEAFSAFLLEHEMQIFLVVFEKESLELSEKLVQSVASYIDEHYVEEYTREIYGDLICRSRRICDREHTIPMPCMAPSLEAYIQKKEDGFSQTLRRLILERGQKNSTVYKKANISKQLFSKLINDPEAKPSKPTAIALALALELDVKGTEDLIGRAGFTLTNSSTFDLIIRYFIECKEYNIVKINLTLYEFDQSLLGM